MLAQRCLARDPSVRAAIAKSRALLLRWKDSCWIWGGSKEGSSTDNEIDAINEEMNQLFGVQHLTKVSQNTTHPFDQGGSVDASFPPQAPSSENQVLPRVPEKPESPVMGSDSRVVQRKEELRLTHVDEHGAAEMVDTSDKIDSLREAGASATVILGKEAFQQVKSNTIEKGDVLTVSKIAGISAAKQTANLIPLCHTLNLRKVDVKFELDESNFAVHIQTLARTVGQTGVEMEALTAASVAALTVYDMCKAVTKSIVISDIRLDHKRGGKSGDYDRMSS